jgi:ribonuclease Z
VSFSVTILGSSGALPALGRYPTSQYIQIGKHHFLIDAGEGAQVQLSRFGGNIHRLDAIFISHLHGDHYLGLMGLLFSMHLNKRQNDLHLYAFKGLREIILLQLKYSKSVLGYTIHFHELKENSTEIVFENDTLTVETIPLLHKIPCNGFLFREKPKPKRINKDKLAANMLIQHIVQLKQGLDVFAESGEILYKNEVFTLPPHPSRTYAFCSDTAYQESMCQQIEGVDLLYHESTFTSEDQVKAIETKHSTAREAALIAKKAGVKKLIIGHFSARYHSPEVLLPEARQTFTETYLAIEGETFHISE